MSATVFDLTVSDSDGEAAGHDFAVIGRPPTSSGPSTALNGQSSARQSAAQVSSFYSDSSVRVSQNGNVSMKQKATTTSIKQHQATEQAEVNDFVSSEDEYIGQSSKHDHRAALMAANNARPPATTQPSASTSTIEAPDTAPPAKRKRRHCMTCNDAECEGRKRRKWCPFYVGDPADDSARKGKERRSASAELPVPAPVMAVVNPVVVERQTTVRADVHPMSRYEQQIEDKVPEQVPPLPTRFLYPWELLGPPVRPATLPPEMYASLQEEIGYLRNPKARTEFSRKQHSNSLKRLGLGRTPAKHSVSLAPLNKRRKRDGRRSSTRTSISAEESAEEPYDELSDLNCAETEEAIFLTTDDESDDDSDDDDPRSMRQRQNDANMRREMRYIHLACNDIERDKATRMPVKPITIAQAPRRPCLEEDAFDTFGGYAAGLRSATIGKQVREGHYLRGKILRKGKARATEADLLLDMDGELETNSHRLAKDAETATSYRQAMVDIFPDDQPVAERKYPRSIGADVYGKKHGIFHYVAAEFGGG